MNEVKAGAIYIPSSEGKSYPRDAVNVTSAAADHRQRVYFHPIGGGFNNCLPLAEFIDKFRCVTPEEKQVVEFREGLFSIDEYFDPPLRGYTRGFLWNGWSMPVFELEDVHRINAVFGEITFDEATDSVICDHGDSEDPEDRYELFKREDVVVDGAIKRVYAVGAGSWCWDDVTHHDT